MVSATIDTGALRHNLNVVRQWAPKSRVMAVIKANAYGHGLVAVARALESADAFAVARVDEGLTLRAAGINTLTVLLEGVFDREQLDAAAGANFELVVHASEQIELLRTAAAGALSGERSLENSAAMLSFPEHQADWVRPGLLLYGVSPFTGSIGADYGLRPAMTLHSHVIAVKDLSPGERVGYGGDWTAIRPTLLAVAAVGYGDGYPRSLPSGAPVLVNGERAGLVGRVSMDMTGIDVTNLRRPPVLGDPVVLWGEGLPVEEIAVWADTIPYELLCGISQRVAVTLR